MPFLGSARCRRRPTALSRVAKLMLDRRSFLALLATVSVAFAVPPSVREAIIAAKTELKSGKVSAGTVQKLATAYKESNEHPAVAQSYAMALISRGETTQALPLMRSAVNLAPTAPGMASIMHTLADEEVKVGPMDEAKRLLHKSIAVQPAGSLAVDAYHRLGNLLSGAAAQEAYRNSLVEGDKLRKRPKTETLIALALGLLGESTASEDQEATEDVRMEALALSRRALEVDKSSGMAYMTLGRALTAHTWANGTNLNEADCAEALQALKLARELGLERRVEAAMLHMRGSLMAAAPRASDKNVEEAMKLLKSAVKLMPD
jgi:tetratricopeptide (TPR) repeat protein